MPSSSLCTSCLRAVQRSAVRRTTTPTSFFPSTQRAYGTASPALQSLHLHVPVPSTQRPPKRPLRSIHPMRPATIRRSLATAATPTSQPSDPQPARAILNPRTTETGEPMRISLSPRASHRLSAISTSENNPFLALRVSIESGGCHGFQYLMNLVDLEKSPATEEDTVFEGDRNAKVVVDEASLELLNGSTIDYTMELIGSQFKVTGIPGATSSCGCGTSFDIKL